MDCSAKTMIAPDALRLHLAKRVARLGGERPRRRTQHSTLSSPKLESELQRASTRDVRSNRIPRFARSVCSTTEAGAAPYTTSALGAYCTCTCSAALHSSDCCLRCRRGFVEPSICGTTGRRAASPRQQRRRRRQRRRRGRGRSPRAAAVAPGWEARREVYCGIPTHSQSRSPGPVSAHEV